MNVPAFCLVFLIPEIKARTAKWEAHPAKWEAHPAKSESHSAE